MTPDRAAKWVQIVCSVDEDPRASHPLLFYAATGGVLAEQAGTAVLSDYADPPRRAAAMDSIIVPLAKPYESQQPAQWKDVTVTHAHRALALRA